MKKVVLTSFLTVCLVGTAQAALYQYTFNFDSGMDMGTVGSIREGAEFYNTESPLPALYDYPGDGYVADAGQGNHQIWIDLAVPVTSISFDFATLSDPFKLEVFYAGSTDADQIFNMPRESDKSGEGITETFGAPVVTLFFHDGDNDGGIGIDNLVLNPGGIDPLAVPLPGSILLGVFAVGWAGRKLRQFV